MIRQAAEEENMSTIVPHHQQNSTQLRPCDFIVCRNFDAIDVTEAK
jgi:hypothetical protein